MYRPEYPRPSFVRENWQNLNGQWEFEIDKKKDYLDADTAFDSKIEVPFCPESKLSGIEHKDFMTSVWYRRTVDITAEQLSGKVLIHFGAVDYEARLFVNGKKAGVHKGGYISFTFDITEYLHEGENTLILNAIDDTKNLTYPSGKQSNRLESYGCSYTRTTGIWQTVWLEFVNKTYISGRKITAYPEAKTISFIGLVENGEGAQVKAEVFYQGEKVGESSGVVSKREFNFNADIDGDIKLWDVLKPEIYDIVLTVTNNGETVDTVKTYTGFRTIELADGKFLLNGKSVFLRQILDQGFYPDGVYTAPDVKDIEKDIDIAIDFGFNGARPHEKIFEEQYLYYADMKGYLVWGEFPNWGCQLDTKKKPNGLKNFLNEWGEELVRDYNHPAIIGWCPLNETWDKPQYCDAYAQKNIYVQTKRYDPIRPVIGSSGGYLYITDIDDYHDYSHTAEEILAHVHDHKNGIIEDKKIPVLNKLQKRELLTQSNLKGLPIFLSEYGGISINNDESVSWGYVKETSEEDFVAHYISDTEAILSSDCMGMCYTQLTDVEQEQNGLVTYERKHKFSEAARKKIRECNMSKAKIED